MKIAISSLYNALYSDKADYQIIANPFLKIIWDIGNQIRINTQIIERNYPDPEPGVVPHIISTLNRHILDKVEELGNSITDEMNNQEKTLNILSKFIIDNSTVDQLASLEAKFKEADISFNKLGEWSR